MSEIDIQAAAGFVQRHATPIERARLRYVLDQQPAPEDIREQLERSQRGDGGWAASWSPDYSSLDATCYQLSQADQLGIDRRSLMVVDAIRFLAERQQMDGSWEEEPSEVDAAPLWATPGDVAAGLYVTANCGFWVARSALVPSAAHDAALYLSFHLSRFGALPSFPHTHWLATALWQHQGMRDEAGRGLAYLGDRIPQLSAGNLAWMIIALLQGGVAAGHETVIEALDQLVNLRDRAGHWPPDEDANNAVHVTIEALLALRLGGRIG